MIEQFIKDAIAGGWQQHLMPEVEFQYLHTPRLSRVAQAQQLARHFQITQDADAWQAVEKTNEWSYARRDLFNGYIASGKSVDEALELVYSVSRPGFAT